MQNEDVVNIYSIYDRLLGHWSPPYFNHSTKEFLSGLSKAINDPQNNLPVALKPEHFAVWQIAQVDSGYVTNIERHLVAECATLVRNRIRPEPNAPGETLGGSQTGERYAPGEPTRPANSGQRPSPGQIQATRRPGAPLAEGPGGTPQ